MIAQNVEHLRKTIREVCSRCGRREDEITLVAVSKSFGPEAIKEVVDAGVLDVGENYVQELRVKRRQLEALPIRWHFVGHLQSNKAKYIADFVHLIHTVDSVGLGLELQKRAARANRILDVLVEVHSTGEATKYGVPPAGAIELVKELSRLNSLRVRGLMTMGPLSDDPEDSRPAFQQLSRLRRRIEEEGIENVQMKHLSMGMTHDFAVALEEGATILRIGTAIFGMRKPGD